MSIYRPGGVELTRYALEKIKAAPGAVLLDVGCGDGTAAQCAQNEFGLCVTATDIDEEAVTRAKARGVDARCADIETMDIPERLFDIVLMECVLSLLDPKKRVLEKICSMLCPGGYLILSDLYRKNECADAHEGTIDLKVMVKWLKELGMECTACEDRTRDLKAFAAQAVMSHGSVRAWFEAEGGWKPSGLCRFDKGMGYFLLFARKAHA